MTRSSRSSTGLAVLALSFSATLTTSSSVIADDDGIIYVPQGLGISDSFGKWPNGVVPWVYNTDPDTMTYPNGSTPPGGFTDDATAVARMEAALKEWEDVCNVDFVYMGVDDTADIDTFNDGVVVMQWENIAGAGLAGPSWNGGQDRTGPGHFEYNDGTIRIDPATFDLTGLSADDITNRLVSFNQTFAHEAGHVLGLGHSSDHNSIMFANPYNSLDKIRKDDIDSCRSLYGYSDLYKAPAKYVPLPLAAVDPTSVLFLSSFSDCVSMAGCQPTTNDLDASMVPFADNDTLALRWQVLGGAFPQTLTQTIVDPSGHQNLVSSTEVVAPSGGAFGVASFGRLRELPGDWVVHVDYAGERAQSLVLTVTAAPPTSIENPVATLSYTENPATREVTVTVDVASVSALAPTSTEATVDWHIASEGNIQEVIAVPGQSSLPLMGPLIYGDSLPHEIYVEVNDDRPRPLYSGTPGGANSGDGFQTLLHYFSSGLNHGPDGSGDNSSDILLFNPVSRAVFFWNMHGNLIDPRGPVAVLSEAGWSVAGRGDYNGDGKNDILWRNVDGRLYYWRMDGSTIVSSAPVATLSSANWQIVGDGDYDGDGNSDILFRNTSTQQVYLWTMNGATITGPAQIAVLNSASWQVVGDKDFDGDGIADIMWFNTASGEVYFWKMNGATIVSSARVAWVSDFLLWQVVSDGDQDADGNADLTWQRRGGGQDGKVYYWRMDGATILSSARISIVGDQDWSVVGGGDLNGDGNADLTWFNITSRQIYHWQQDGALTLRGGQIATGLAADWEVVNVN